MKRILILALAILVCLSSVVFGANESAKDTNRLYVEDGTGKYSGYNLLKGHPDEKKFQIYFKVHTKENITSYEIKVIDLRKIDLSATIKWKYNGKTYKTKRKDLYNYFVDVTSFRNKFKINGSTVLSTDWLIKTFGDVYTEWAEGYYFEDEASRLVDSYIMQINESSDKNSNVSLTPDTEVVAVEEKKPDPTIEDVISSLQNKNMPAELKEFNIKWIGEKELSDSYNIKIHRLPGSIKFYNDSNNKLLYEIQNVPKEPANEKVYTENNISYQYIQGKNFTGSGGEMYVVKGFYFDREDLKIKNLIK